MPRWSASGSLPCVASRLGCNSARGLRGNHNRSRRRCRHVDCDKRLGSMQYRKACLVWLGMPSGGRFDKGPPVGAMRRGRLLCKTHMHEAVVSTTTRLLIDTLITWRSLRAARRLKATSAQSSVTHDTIRCLSRWRGMRAPCRAGSTRVGRCAALGHRLRKALLLRRRSKGDLDAMSVILRAGPVSEASNSSLAHRALKATRNDEGLARRTDIGGLPVSDYDGYSCLSIRRRRRMLLLLRCHHY
jgi:hypothetical protein